MNSKYTISSLKWKKKSNKNWILYEVKTSLWVYKVQEVLKTTTNWLRWTYYQALSRTYPVSSFIEHRVDSVDEAKKICEEHFNKRVEELVAEFITIN